MVVEDIIPIEKETLPPVEGAEPLHQVDGAVPPEGETNAALDHCERDDPVVEERTYQYKPPITKMMRLVEPAQNEAPTKRRRGKGKRKLDGLTQGTLHHFLIKSINTKECTNGKTTEVEPRALRKRKQELMVEEPMVEDPVESGSKRTRRTMIGDDVFPDRTLRSQKNLWGWAKSVSEGEPLKGRSGINWVEKIENAVIQTPRGITEKTKNHINAQ